MQPRPALQPGTHAARTVHRVAGRVADPRRSLPDGLGLAGQGSAQLLAGKRLSTICNPVRLAAAPERTLQVQASLPRAWGGSWARTRARMSPRASWGAARPPQPAHSGSSASARCHLHSRAAHRPLHTCSRPPRGSGPPASGGAQGLPIYRWPLAADLGHLRAWSAPNKLLRIEPQGAWQQGDRVSEQSLGPGQPVAAHTTDLAPQPAARRSPGCFRPSRPAARRPAAAERRCSSTCRCHLLGGPHSLASTLGSLSGRCQAARAALQAQTPAGCARRC